MFEPTKQIIYIDRKQLRLGEVKNGKVKSDILITQQWNLKNLSAILVELKKKYHLNSFDLLLGSDLSYVFNEDYQDKPKELVSYLEKSISEKVPEKSENLSWYYEPVSQNKESVQIQVVVFVSDVFQAIAVACQKAELTITRVESLSVSLSKQIPQKNKNPLVLLYGGYQNVSLFFHQGMVFAADQLEPEDSNKALHEFLKYFEDRYQIKPDKILTAGKIELKQGQTQHLQIHPYLGIKPNKHRRRFNLGVTKVPGEKMKFTQKYILIGVTASVLIITLIIIIFFIFKNFYPSSQTMTTPVIDEVTETLTQENLEPEPTTETQEVSLTPIELAEYQVEIQNGSGTAGEASYVQSILSDEGFAKFETSNAESFDFQETIVQLKPDTPPRVAEAIERALNDTYQLKTASFDLTEDTSYDVLIIIGTRI